MRLFFLIYLFFFSCTQNNALEIKQKPLSSQWEKVKELENKLQYKATLVELEKIYKNALESNNDDELAKALFERVRLTVGFHGYEKAVRLLYTEKWPESKLERGTLHLFRANTLMVYYNSYSWEIRRREEIDSKVVDLKKWTAQQIFQKIQEDYLSAWKMREDLSKVKIENWFHYFDIGSFPIQVYSTIEDFLTYSWVQFLSNSQTWSPQHGSELYKVPFDKLVNHKLRKKIKVSLNDESHPLLKINTILLDYSEKRFFGKIKENQLQAHLYFYQTLFTHFSRAEQREHIRKNLKKTLKAFQNLEWWAYAQYIQATWFDLENNKKAAHSLCNKTIRKFRKEKNLGHKNCKALIERIEMPYYSMKVRTNNGLTQSSLHFSYKNLKKIHFRAYKMNLSKVLKNKKWNIDSGINFRKIEDLNIGKLVKTWEQDLTETKNYLERKINIKPQVNEKGLYIILASSKKDFSKKENQLNYVQINITNLYGFISEKKKYVEVGVRTGEKGKPVSQAKVRLYSFRWQGGATFLKEYKSDEEGWARIPYADKSKRSYYHFITISKGSETFLGTEGLYFYPPHHQKNKVRRFIYTDRSIYRPEQEISFKVVSAENRNKKNSIKTSQYLPRKRETLSIVLYDSNYKIVKVKKVTTNSYGTASGKFKIPKGRALGAWRVALKGSWMETNSIRVEEYKRPTFLVEFKTPKEESRLNEKVTLKGETKYYFGQPVQGAKVKYSVSRYPVYPWWFWWRYNYEDFNQISNGVIEEGTAVVDEKGEFLVPFLPEADPSLKKKSSVYYRFVVTAHVTDKGGETRSSSFSVNLGYVGVKTQIKQDENFFLEEDFPKLSFLRTNLSGEPQAGAAQIKILQLIVPERVREKYQDQEKIDKGSVEGVWTHPKEIEQEVFDWENGKEVFAKDFKHDKNGEYSLQVDRLKHGVYRLIYTTRDKWGEEFQTEKIFLVVHPDMKLPVKSFLLAKKNNIEVGENFTLFYGSGYQDQGYYFTKFQDGKMLSRNHIEPLKGKTQLKLETFKTTEEDRGGVNYKVSLVNQFRLMEKSQTIQIPWSNKKLNLEMTTFRDLIRPGQKETWTLKIKGPEKETFIAEVLAYMYDKSLDQISPHYYPSLSNLYPGRGYGTNSRELHRYHNGSSLDSFGWTYKYFTETPYFAKFKSVNRYGVGGLGGRRLYRGAVSGGLGRSRPESSSLIGNGLSESDEDFADEEGALDQMSPAPEENKAVLQSPKKVASKREKRKDKNDSGASAKDSAPLRSNFSETAFFFPHLETQKDGSVTLSFVVPDSLTTWNFYAHAHTKDFSFGVLNKETISQKELMVRPYMPRFLREGDKGLLKVVINNATQGKRKRNLEGDISLQILDLKSNKDVTSLFQIKNKSKKFNAPGEGSSVVKWDLKAPNGLGNYSFKVVAQADNLKDGELRPLPLLPSRTHLFQSRFVTLKDQQKRKMVIEDLKKSHLDKTLIHDSLTVNVDGQLIFTVLKAIPYLINYPYECTEQTLNRFLSTSIVHSTFDQFPSIKRMAKKFLAKRKTQLEKWDKKDINRKINLEETPWMYQSEGGESEDLLAVLDAKIVKQQKEKSLKKLKEMQLPDGGFPWFPGGRANLYMTLYALNGFAKAYEHKVKIPKSMVQKAIKYVNRYDGGHFCKPWSEYGTFFNYILSNFPADFYSKYVSEKRRDEILKCSWDHWKDHSPYGKAYLALTLKRKNRLKDAKLIMAAIMDSSETAEDQGTFWAPEDYGWLWYNDNIESHAFVLRALSEISPEDKRRDGLALWLLLNKKLNQWKSTRATAEVIYALLHYMKGEGSLGKDEVINVKLGDRDKTFVLKADEYTGNKNKIIIPGNKVDGKKYGETIVSKETPGFAFASVMWHYSTEKLPPESRGDFLKVNRKYFKRVLSGKKYTLKPLSEGEKIFIGDQIEVQLSIKAKHQFEYVHLRDPRGAGFEPETQMSRYKWQTGIGYYEEVRDSSTNFFFSWLPQGEYNFKYRVRANMAGEFRVGPATLQSLYAPEFGAFSSGKKLIVGDSI